MKNVRKSYDNGADALKGINLEVADGEFVFIVGHSGAGKTTLISRIAALLGAKDSVTSPTFAIVNQYEGDRTIFHFDMYRIERVEEALDFGCEEYFASGELCLVEWPEKIEPLLPEDTMVVRIEIKSDTERRFVIR